MRWCGTVGPCWAAQSLSWVQASFGILRALNVPKHHILCAYMFSKTCLLRVHGVVLEGSSMRGWWGLMRSTFTQEAKIWRQCQVPRHRAPSPSWSQLWLLLLFCKTPGWGQSLSPSPWVLATPSIPSYGFVGAEHAGEYRFAPYMPGATLNSIHPTYSKLVGISSTPAPSLCPFGNAVGTGGSASGLGVGPWEGKGWAPLHFQPSCWNFGHLHAFSVSSHSNEVIFPCWEYNSVVDVRVVFHFCVRFCSVCNLLTLHMDDVVRLPGTVVL